MSSFVRIGPEALRGDALDVARRLLGARLVRVVGGERRAGRIVETEAYRPDDPASHAFRGQTPRNRSMFGPPGLAYVYFTYGSCFCVNVVCEPAGVGAAVLLRALEPEEGLEAMIGARGRERDLASGPGRLCQALAIDRAQDGLDLLGSQELFLEAGEPVPDERVARTPRIGISQARELPWRFAIAGNPHLSRPAKAAPSGVA
jgi:DNA-3-methyladenine glycosylase